MSFVSYLVYGPYGPQEEYRRDYYEPDAVYSDQSTGNFSGRIVSTRVIDKYEEINIDNAITVKTVANDILNDAKGFWSKQYRNCMITFTVTLIGGIFGIAGAVALGTLCPPLLPLALVVGVLALEIFTGSFFFLYRGQEAKHELEQWGDSPVNKICEQRKKVGEKGFDSLTDDLKGKAVHPDEYKILWYTEMQNWYENFTSYLPVSPRDKVELIRTFIIDSSLLAREKFVLAFGSEDTCTDQSLEALCGDFKTLQDRALSICTCFELIKIKLTDDKRYYSKAGMTNWGWESRLMKKFSCFNKHYYSDGTGDEIYVVTDSSNSRLESNSLLERQKVLEKRIKENVDDRENPNWELLELRFLHCLVENPGKTRKKIHHICLGVMNDWYNKEMEKFVNTKYAKFLLLLQPINKLLHKYKQWENKPGKQLYPVLDGNNFTNTWKRYGKQYHQLATAPPPE